jgi:hypothetical protein
VNRVLTGSDRVNDDLCPVHKVLTGSEAFFRQALFDRQDLHRFIDSHFLHRLSHTFPMRLAIRPKRDNQDLLLAPRCYELLRNDRSRCSELKFAKALCITSNLY